MNRDICDVPTAIPAAGTSDLAKDSDARRRTMVDCQIRTFDVTDQRVIERFLEVPRELFTPENAKALAYSDMGLVLNASDPAGEARYMLPPFVLARLLQGGRLRPTDRVLDVAPGTGYSTAILAGLASEVFALEATPALRMNLDAALAAFGLAGIQTKDAALPDGWPSRGPYDVILVNGAVQTSLDRLFGQLADGGRLLAIRCDSKSRAGHAAKATCFEKHGQSIGTRFLFDTAAPCLRAFQETPQFVF